MAAIGDANPLRVSGQSEWRGVCTPLSRSAYAKIRTRLSPIGFVSGHRLNESNKNRSDRLSHSPCSRCLSLLTQSGDRISKRRVTAIQHPTIDGRLKPFVLVLFANSPYRSKHCRGKPLRRWHFLSIRSETLCRERSVWGGQASLSFLSISESWS